MSRKLDDLSDRFRPLAMTLIARLVEARIPHLITDTRRTPAEHQANLAKGTSRTAHSKHLDGDAIDLVPWEVYTLAPGGDKLAYDLESPAAVAAWKAMGQIGESLGLRWGGRFAPVNRYGLGWDPGHFEYPTASGPDLAVGTRRV
jgi:D-alanyl-D-alanine carboxypeptidase